MANKENNIAGIRNDYKKEELSESQTNKNPLLQFDHWLNEALDANVAEATAMIFSTVSSDNRPSSRVLLLKGINDNGLVFFTNYQSRKGQELNNNNAGSITFFWPELERQVRIEGFVEKINVEESEEYFYSRPFDSRIGAYISPQSKEISKEELEKRYREAKEKFTEDSLKKPEHWGGYCLVPDYYEFWQGRPGRLHDRICYIKDKDEWAKKRLAP
ncbi:MAG: pyridoxamine 5'-phosphate oxidase [Cytophagaceae bacterium]